MKPLLIRRSINCFPRQSCARMRAQTIVPAPQALTAIVVHVPEHRADTMTTKSPTPCTGRRRHCGLPLTVTSNSATIISQRTSRATGQFLDRVTPFRTCALPRLHGRRQTPTPAQRKVYENGIIRHPVESISPLTVSVYK